MRAVWANHAKEPELTTQLGNYAALRIWGKNRDFPGSTCMAVVDDANTVCAVMVFYDYDAEAGVIQISGAADTPKWLTRKILKEMFEYPFVQLGCQAVVMRVAPENKRLGRILTALGFERTVVKRLRGRNEDECLFVLYDDVWRSNGFHED